VAISFCAATSVRSTNDVAQLVMVAAQAVLDICISAVADYDRAHPPGTPANGSERERAVPVMLGGIMVSARELADRHRDIKMVAQMVCLAGLFASDDSYACVSSVSCGRCEVKSWRLVGVHPHSLTARPCRISSWALTSPRSCDRKTPSHAERFFSHPFRTLPSYSAWRRLLRLRARAGPRIGYLARIVCSSQASTSTASIASRPSNTTRP